MAKLNESFASHCCRYKLLDFAIFALSTVALCSCSSDHHDETSEASQLAKPESPEPLSGLEDSSRGNILLELVSTEEMVRRLKIGMPVNEALAVLPKYGVAPFSSPSIISIDTEHRSNGNAPEAVELVVLFCATKELARDAASFDGNISMVVTAVAKRVRWTNPEHEEELEYVLPAELAGKECNLADTQLTTSEVPVSR